MAESVFHTTLEREGNAEFVEKKSVFIGHACPVSSEEEALAYVKKKKSVGLVNNGAGACSSSGAKLYFAW